MENSRLMDWCNKNDVNLTLLRKVGRQQVRDGDSTVVWDAFELPKEFEGEYRKSQVPKLQTLSNVSLLIHF